MKNQAMQEDLDFRLKEQKRLKRDLLVKESPLSNSIFRICNWTAKFHLAFIIVLLCIHSFSPNLGDALARILSPLPNFMYAVLPGAVGSSGLSSNMSADYYRCVASETLLAGMLLAILLTSAFVVRYRSMPWRLSEFILEQLNVRRSCLSGLILLLVSSSVFFFVGFAVLVWFGFVPSGDSGTITASQLTLWALLSCGGLFVACFLFLLIASCAMWIGAKLIGYR